MKNIDSVDVKAVIQKQGGFTIRELREFAAWPASVRPAHLTLTRDDEQRNRALVARMGLLAVSKGLAIIELTHDEYSDEGIEALEELIENTLIGCRVYLSKGKGVILLDKVF